MRRAKGIKQAAFYAVANTIHATAGNRRVELSATALQKGRITFASEGGNLKIRYGDSDVDASTSSYHCYAPAGSIVALDLPTLSPAPTHMSVWSDSTLPWALVAWEEE